MQLRIAPVVLALALLSPLSIGETPSFVPAVLEGYALAPLAPLPIPTSIAFGPGGSDGPDLYATVLSGSVLRVALEWTPAGPVARGVSTHASGFSLPLGLEFDAAGNLYVTDSHAGTESGRTDGRLTRVAPDGTRLVLVDGIPNGRHNANNLRWGPDGRLYVANGNPNDSGPDSGPADVFPYSGAILSVDVAQVAAAPTVLRWRDAAGARIAPDDIATHPLNADFASKVHVLAWGFRNIYDVAFSPTGAAYTATNGADYPNSQDLLYKVTPGADHGFPFCYNEGPAGGTGDDVTIAPNPVYDDAARCAGVPRATALLGWHVCATGLDFARTPGWGNAVYVAECGPFWIDALTESLAEDPRALTHSTGHKVVRVTLDENGEATEVRDFLTGLALPTDVLFGPDGAMYVADAEGVTRVSPVGLGASTPPPPAVRAVAGPLSQSLGYATRSLAVPAGGPLTLTSLDVFRHDLVAHGVYGSNAAPWCDGYALDRCPLFWSEQVDFGETPVLGLDALVPGKAYPFYCTLHPVSMRGTLVALPST